jgi:hypothetical protein
VIPLARLQGDVAAVRNVVTRFRQRLEAEAPRDGLLVESRIHTAATCLRRHLQAERKLHELRDSLTLEQWLSLTDRSLKWKLACDHALAGLLEGGAKPDVWATIYGQTINGTAPPPQDGPPPAAITPPGHAEDAGQPAAAVAGQDAPEAILGTGKTSAALPGAGGVAEAPGPRPGGRPGGRPNERAEGGDAGMTEPGQKPEVATE